ncbi:MAG: hypothetical protein WCD86_19600 [Ktedonobacteraceae bacterium]
MMTAGELWPSRDEYDLAVARWAETLLDPELRGGKLDYDHLGIRRYGGANLYVCIYKISDWMIRCFCSTHNRLPPADIRERYRAIAAFSEQYSGRIAALAHLTYYDQGVTVGSRFMPLVKMPFFAGCPSLGEFLMDHYSEAAVMQQLCDAWLRMIGELETASMAHGDLDLSNVLVERRGPTLVLRLIDYDNTWIPALSGRGQTEHGHQHFQHPAFMPPNLRPFAVDMDRFSALVIYISLKTLISQPQLYDQWGADESERLLFADTDYQNAGQPGNRIAQLRQVCTPDLYPYLDELQAALRERRMPRSLSAIAPVTLPPPPADGYRPPAPPAQPPIGPPPPPRALWNQARYNPQSSFPFPSPPVGADLSRPPLPSLPVSYQIPGSPPASYTPSTGSPGPSWGERTGVNPVYPPPGRPQGNPRYAEDDTGRPAAPSWPNQPPVPMTPPVGADLSRPPHNPLSDPGLGNSVASSPSPAPWSGASISHSNPGFGSADAALPPQMVAPPLSHGQGLADVPPMPTPIPPTAADEDDTPRPLNFAPSAGAQFIAPTGQRRLLIWIIVGVLIAIIIGAAIMLALLFIPGVHMGNMGVPGLASQEVLVSVHAPNIPDCKGVPCTPTPSPPITPTPTPTPRPRPTPTPTSAPISPTPTPRSAPIATPKATATKVPTPLPTPTPTVANNSGGITGVGGFHPGGPIDPPSGSPFSDPLVYVLLGMIVAASATLVVVVKKTHLLGR